MAEIVGLVAATLSIAKTVKTVVEVVKLLYDTAKNPPRVAQNMARFAASLNNFANTVESAIYSLRKCFEKNLDSPVVQMMNKQRHLKGIATESRLLKMSVKELRDKISNIHHRWKWRTCWRWTRFEPDLKDLFPPMTNFQTMLSLTIDAVNLERQTTVLEKLGSSNKELEKEIEQLKQKIGQHIEMIRQVREENGFTPPVFHSALSASDAKTVDSQIMLCHLAQSVVESGTVPSTPPEDFRFPKLEIKRHRWQSSAEAPRPQFQSPPIGSRASLRSERERSTTGSALAASTLAAVSSPSAPSTPTVMQQVDGEEQPRRRRIRRRSGNGTPPKDDTSGPPMTTVVKTPVEEPWQRTRGPGPSKKGGKDCPGLKVNLWARGKDARKEVDAIINKQEKYNFVSQDLAQQLGWMVRKHNKATAVITRYDGIVRQSLGIAHLFWGETKLPCPCYVIKDLETPLIFGRTMTHIAEEKEKPKGL